MHITSCSRHELNRVIEKKKVTNVWVFRDILTRLESDRIVAYCSDWDQGLRDNVAPAQPNEDL